jgi:hypothetical protein
MLLYQNVTITKWYKKHVNVSKLWCSKMLLMHVTLSKCQYNKMLQKHITVSKYYCIKMLLQQNATVANATSLMRG